MSINDRKVFDYADFVKLWNVRRKMRIPEHIIAIMQNLCTGQEATIEVGRGKIDWHQVNKTMGKKHSPLIYSTCMLNMYI